MGKKSRRGDKPAKKQRIQFVDRPFEGLDAEADLVAMKELLPAATLPATTTAEYGSEDILLATILPGMAAAMRRKDGVLLVATQTVMNSGDASRDLADRIIAGLELAPGASFMQSEQPEPGPRLGDVVNKFGEISISDACDFWVTDEEMSDPNVAAAIAQTRENLTPVKAIDGVEGAYWCRMSREFLRWIRHEDEEAVLNGITRLHHKRESGFDEARFIGAFRAAGVLIPVWELARGTEADELTGVLAEFKKKFDDAVADTTPLTAEEKRTKAGIVSRQVTLR